MSRRHLRHLVVEDFLRETASLRRAVLAGRAPVRRPLALVVEEVKEITDIEAVILEREGFRTERAYDGITGLRLARQLSPELLVLDFMMLGMDGMRVLEELRARPIGRRPAVIFQTGDCRPETRIRALERGADAFLLKPFNLAQLVDQAKRLTAR